LEGCRPAKVRRLFYPQGLMLQRISAITGTFPSTTRCFTLLRHQREQSPGYSWLLEERLERRPSRIQPEQDTSQLTTQPCFASYDANHRACAMVVQHGNLHVLSRIRICLICTLRERFAGRKIMCHYCSGYPSYPYYSPYQYYGMSYGYPYSGYGFPYYGLPLGYAYTYPSQPVYFAAAPQYPRGEHRVGNCLMICQ